MPAVVTDDASRMTAAMEERRALKDRERDTGRARRERVPGQARTAAAEEQRALKDRERDAGRARRERVPSQARTAAATEERRAVAARRRTAAERVRQSYRVMVEWRRGIVRCRRALNGWRRGITNALYTEDNLQVQVPVYVSLLLIAGYVSVGALMFGLWESDWDFLVGSYFCFITLSTIGFGDFVPGTGPDAWASQEKLCLCSVYLIVGLALLAMCFDLMQEEARNTFRRCGRRVGLLPRTSNVEPRYEPRA